MKLEKLDVFLFSPVHPRSAILFRVLVAMMLAFMFAPRGLDPIFPLSNFPSFRDLVFSDAYYVLIYVLILLFAIGLKPQITALLLFVVLLPHDFVDRGRASKQVILCVLMCFVFLRSLPLWYIRKKGFKTNDLAPIWPIRLIQIQLTLLYGVNALAKTTYHYLSGEALMNMSIAYDNFHFDFSDCYFHMGSIQVPIFILAILSVLTEYFLAIGLWFNKTKWFAIVVGILFHFVLTFIISIFMLDYISVFLYLAFIIPFKFKGIRAA